MTRIDTANTGLSNLLESDTPARPGAYILILRNPREQSIQIGRLGRFDLRPGYYAYAGSALGPGGLRARLHHHLHLAARLHWHIDYLRRITFLEQIWLVESAVRREHNWAALLQELAEMRFPIQRFGATDCSCEAHLLYSPVRPSVEEFRACIYRYGLADPLIRCIEVIRSFSPVGKYPADETAIS